MYAGCKACGLRTVMLFHKQAMDGEDDDDTTYPPVSKPKWVPKVKPTMMVNNCPNPNVLEVNIVTLRPGSAMLGTG